MARTIPLSRNPQAARARRAKIMLLPMPRARADELSLQVHVALDAMRRGKDNMSAAQILCQVMILVGLLAEAGYGSATFEQMQDAEEVIAAAFDRGRDTGMWMHRRCRFCAVRDDRQHLRLPASARASRRDRRRERRAGLLPRR
jgi:hypothetical protein